MLKIRQGIIYWITKIPKGYAILRFPPGDAEAELIAAVENLQNIEQIIEEDTKWYLSQN